MEEDKEEDLIKLESYRLELNDQWVLAKNSGDEKLEKKLAGEIDKIDAEINRFYELKSIHEEEKALTQDSKALDTQVMEKMQLIIAHKATKEDVLDFIQLVAKRFYVSNGALLEKIQEEEAKEDKSVSGDGVGDKTGWVSRIPSFEITQLGENTLGLHDSYDNLISISTALVDGILNDENINLAQLVDTLGHELRHWEQFKIFQLMDEKELNELSPEQRGIIDQVLNKLGRKEYPKERIDRILTAMSKRLGTKFSNKIISMTEEERKAQVADLSFADYISRKYEEDAREYGEAFVKRVFGYYLQNPSTNLETRKFLSAQLKVNLKQIKETNEQYKKEYKKIEIFKKEVDKYHSGDYEGLLDFRNFDLKNFDVENCYLDGLEIEAIEYLRDFVEAYYTKKDNTEGTNTVFDKLEVFDARVKCALKNSYENKKPVEIYEDLLVCLSSRGYDKSVIQLQVDCLSEKNLTEEQKIKISAGISKDLLKIKSNIYGLNLTKLFNKDQAKDFISSLLKDKVISLAINQAKMFFAYAKSNYNPQEYETFCAEILEELYETAKDIKLSIANEDHQYFYSHAEEFQELSNIDLSKKSKKKFDNIIKIADEIKKINVEKRKNADFVAQQSKLINTIFGCKEEEESLFF